jgi:DNA-binding transcriptional MerR regulator
MEWTLGELAERVRAALAVGYSGQRSGRVRDVPDARGIRYYTTLGLVDRPTVLHGRGAHYGERHLLQLVAIKRLQAQGLSLAEVQGELAGVGDDRLRELAQVPEEALAPAQRRTGRSRRFWTAPPASSASDVRETSAALADSAEGSLYGVRLAPGVVLLVESPRAPEPHEQRELERAAAPVLASLRAQGLVPDSTERSNS